MLQLPELSTARTAHVTIVPFLCGIVSALMADGQVSVGAVTSVTMTVNETVALLPEASAAQHITTVVPRGKGELTCAVWLHVTGTLPSTLSMAVGEDQLSKA